MKDCGELISFPSKGLKVSGVSALCSGVRFSSLICDILTNDRANEFSSVEGESQPILDKVGKE